MKIFVDSFLGTSQSREVLAILVSSYVREA